MNTKEVKYYQQGRFKRLPEKQLADPYDNPSQILDDLVARRPRPWIVQHLDLATATTNLEFLTPGWAVMIKGTSTTDKTAVQPVVTTAQVRIQYEQPIEANCMGQCYLLKHGEVLPGPFKKFYLSWPAQPGVYGEIIIFQYADMIRTAGDPST